MPSADHCWGGESTESALTYCCIVFDWISQLLLMQSCSRSSCCGRSLPVASLNLLPLLLAPLKTGGTCTQQMQKHRDGLLSTQFFTIYTLKSERWRYKSEVGLLYKKLGWVRPKQECLGLVVVLRFMSILVSAFFFPPPFPSPPSLSLWLYVSF